MAYTAQDIKKLLKEQQAIIGTQRTLKALREGSLSLVVVTSNCPADVREDIAHYAKLASATVEETDVNNEEMGELAKKPFAISVLSFANA